MRLIKIHERMCKKFLGISRFPANWVAELELGKDDEYVGEMLTKDFADGQG
jgi:hypothetical protein